jgi:hypothetical protein
LVPFWLIEKGTITAQELVAMAQAKLIADPMHREKSPQETAIPVEPIRNRTAPM